MSAPSHPFRVAWRTRDIDAWAGALAPDVQVNSPLLKTPFVGRQAAVDLYRVFFEEFGDLDIWQAFEAGDPQAFFWRAPLAGRMVEGVDLLRFDELGYIAEIRVFIRPLVDIGTLVTATGSRLAGLRSPIRAAVARVLILPIRALFALIDDVASRLIQAR
jgi:hypothetical protein